MPDDTIREVEKFLYREARMLDNRQFHEWLELLTDDVRYGCKANNLSLPDRGCPFGCRRYAPTES